MAHFLNGGSWQDGIDAGYFTLGFPYKSREIFSISKIDIDGLPERWVKISKLEVTWRMNKETKTLLAEPKKEHHVKGEFWDAGGIL